MAAPEPRPAVTRRSAHRARRARRPTGVRFVTVPLLHPARNRLPRDFIS